MTAPSSSGLGLALGAVIAALCQLIDAPTPGGPLEAAITDELDAAFAQDVAYNAYDVVVQLRQAARAASRERPSTAVGTEGGRRPSRREGPPSAAVAGVGRALSR